MGDTRMNDTELRITIFGKKGAEAWVRHAYNIPSHVGCWQPYRVLVTSNFGTLSYRAFYTTKEFKNWARNHSYLLKLDKHYKEGHKPAWVARFGKLLKERGKHMKNSCDYHHEGNFIVRILPGKNKTNIIVCYRHYLLEKEMTYDKINFPEWEKLTIYSTEI